MIRRQECKDRNCSGHRHGEQKNDVPYPRPLAHMAEHAGQKKSCGHQQHIESQIHRQPLPTQNDVIEVPRAQHDDAQQQGGEHPRRTAAPLSSPGEQQRGRQIRPKEDFQVFPQTLVDRRQQRSDRIRQQHIQKMQARARQGGYDKGRQQLFWQLPHG